MAPSRNMKMITRVPGKDRAREEASNTWRMVTVMAAPRATRAMATQYSTAALLPEVNGVMNVKMMKTKCGRTRRSQFAISLLAILGQPGTKPDLVAAHAPSSLFSTFLRRNGLLPPILEKSMSLEHLHCDGLVGYVRSLGAIHLRTSYELCVR